MKTHKHRISVDTRKRILLKTLTKAASIAPLFHVFNQLAQYNFNQTWRTSFISNFSCILQVNCALAVQFCSVQQHDNFIPKTKQEFSDHSFYLGRPCVQFEQEIWFLACVNCCFTSHFDQIIVFERFRVDSRIRYENVSVDANRSVRFPSYQNAA